MCSKFRLSRTNIYQLIVSVYCLNLFKILIFFKFIGFRHAVMYPWPTALSGIQSGLLLVWKATQGSSIFGGWQASLTDTLRCVPHKFDEASQAVRVCHFQWRRGTYLCNAASGLCKPVEVAKALHNVPLCDMRKRTRLRRPAGRITHIMQNFGSSIPRQSRYACFAGCGVVATRFGYAASGKIASANAQAEKNASGCPPARRARLAGDCSSLSPLTLKPLRSPTPCPFTAIATAFIVRLRRTRGSAVNGHSYGGFGSWLQRRQPSTMSAGCFLGFDMCRAPPPVRSLRGLVMPPAARKREEVLQVFLPPVF